MNLSEYLYVPFITWALAQVIKFIIAMFRGEYRPALLFASGGMPSVHSATVAALATVALIEAGPGSPLFGITGVFAAIVMYDSLGVRRSAGEQAKVLNRLIADLQTSGIVKSTSSYQHLREILGHRPLEVAIGAVFGIMLASALLFGQVSAQLPWLLTTPSKLAQRLEIGLAVFLILFGLGCWLVSRRKKGGIFARYAPFVRQIFYANLATAGLLLIAVVCQRENISWYGEWIGVIVVMAVFFLWKAWLWYMLLVDGKLRAVTLPASVQRQDKWLKKAKKRSVHRPQ